MSRLIILPENGGTHSGFEIVVQSDIERLQINEQDTVIIYSTYKKVYDGFTPIFLTRPSKYSLSRISNLLQFKRLVELKPSALKAVIPTDRNHYEEVFCGEVFFYRCLKQIFPETRIVVRFHNFWDLIKSRQRIFNYDLGWAFRYRLMAATRIEYKALRDPWVEPIFITDREQQYFDLLKPGEKSDYWGVKVAPRLPDVGFPNKNNLIWFGGLDHHKKYSVQYFIDESYSHLRRLIPEMEFHLFGKGSEKFTAPQHGIYGHGFYEGKNLPMKGDGLFVNPDLLGGGLKVKIMTLLNEGVPFISTPFGVEGYDLPVNRHLIIAPIEHWNRRIAKYFSR